MYNSPYLDVWEIQTYCLPLNPPHGGGQGLSPAGGGEGGGSVLRNQVF
ncbi:MAG: hypothetical protein JETT_3584 [Candidatus Jettenia ecosi]|uniref:Uncharacterized protein n=1 Tax=Candidatus Jettenia ecosi TaxID=2494326 RepID=A0A533Q7N7_9BACT|nr:MAG: hypothetical protein JETT_3584 [Candidatus Jettenia ecosi]